MKKLALANEELLFVKKETVEGTLVYPAATDAILAVGPATTNQEDEFIDDAQVRARRSAMSPIKGRTNPGTWSFTTYVKPSGVLGTPPETDVLWECGLGKKSTPSYVEYSLDSSINLPSFSLWRKVGHTVFAMEGATVNQIEINVAGNEIATVAWSGEFMKWYYGGTDAAQSAVSASASTVVVKDSTRFSQSGMKIVLGDDDNGGVGYTITGNNYTTNTITFSPVAVTGCAQYAVVRGWYPETQTYVGNPVHGKLGYVTIDGTNAVVLGGTITIVNNVKYYVDEKNGLTYARVYGATGYRNVTGAIRAYFYKNMPTYFYRSAYQIQDALLLPAGNVSGKIMEVSCPYIEYKTPVISGDEEVQVEIPFTAVGSAGGDDEIKVNFK